MNLSHLLRLTDDTGILQHARYSLVDRDHGYTTDDNARALLFTVEAAAGGGESLDESGAALLDPQARYRSFVDHSFDPASGRFRAYMRFDRTWAPERSEDADGRAIWSLGTCAARSNDAGLRSATRELMHRALPSADGVTSPRAWAHTLLGLNAYLERHADDAGPFALQAELAGRLRHHFERHMQPNWPWPEECLTYDNARFAAGAHCVRSRAGRCADGRPRAPRPGMAGRRADRAWSVRPDRRRRLVPAGWREQPIRPAATGGVRPAGGLPRRHRRWRRPGVAGGGAAGVALVPRWQHARHGRARRGVGGCRDGITPSGPNRKGAESTLAWLSAQLVAHELHLDAGPTRRATPVAGRGGSL